MKEYKKRLQKTARKFIDKRNPNDKEAILSAIEKLPYEGNIKQLEGVGDNAYRLVVGGYRILYRKYDDVLLIKVADAGNRGDVYKNPHI